MPKPPDDNDRAREGTLPHDPEADAEPMPPPGLAPKLAELLPAAVSRMTARAEGKEKPIPLPWKTANDALGGGLWPGHHVLVGNTGVGKTQFCLQAALEAARAGTPVLYLALEAQGVEFVARCFGLVAGTWWSELCAGKHPRLGEILQEHRAELAHLPFHVTFGEARGWDYTVLEDEVRKLREAYSEAWNGTLLVVLDFLQIVGAGFGSEGEDLRQRIGNACNLAAHVARVHNAAVLLASSTARANYALLRGEKGGEKEERRKVKLGGSEWDAASLVGLGKESGEVEFAADTVLVLTEDPWPEGVRPKDGSHVWLAVAKRRMGKCGWVELRFDGRNFGEPGAPTPLPGVPGR